MSTNTSLQKSNRKLTEKQQSFLDYLIETGGNPKEAAELAGYSGNHYQVIQTLREEIVDLASDVLARSAPQAAFKLVEVMNSDKSMPQVNTKLQAAQTILDRVGVSKRERLDVNHNVNGGIFILPEKQPIEVIPEEDGGVTLDFEPGAINIPGTEAHFDNLADILPDDVLDPVGNEMTQNYMDYKGSRKEWEQG